MGYRVGGTAFCALALIESGKKAEPAIERAAKFVVEGLKDPLMGDTLDPAYDVRGWGHTYALLFLLRVEKAKQAPKGSREAIEFCITALEKMELPESGGWNYAAAGAKKPSPPSTFMTAPTILALWQAQAQGYKVSEPVLKRALASLEKARLDSGAFQYSSTGRKTGKGGEAVQASGGRAPLCEMTLLLAGTGTVDRVKQAVDAFFEHWEWLEKRRQQQGTHVEPYMIAPYYFFFAHAYAAMAIELLADDDRPERRKKLAALLFKVRDADGSWNDRVFPRSKNFGTACALLAFLAPKLPRPAGPK